MEYIIAGIRIDIPRIYAGDAFGMALAPFAAKEAADTGTAGRARDTRKGMPGTGTKGAACTAGNGTPARATDSGAEGMPDASMEKTAGTDAPNATDVTGKGTAGAAIARQAPPAHDKAQPDLTLVTGQTVGEAAGYRELDAFDFTDADADCRFGRDEAGYLLTMTPRDGSAPARFRKGYDTPVATSDITPGHNPALFRFGLWTVFNIAALRQQAVAVHTSVICLDGQAVLFLGESGTGKSTHTRLWREHIPGARLLNDDSPIVRIARITTTALSGADNAKSPAPEAREAAENTGQNAKPARTAAADTQAYVTAAQDSGTGSISLPNAQGDGIEVLAYGSPWSGKTPCYRNEHYPIAGIVRLSQAPHNRIRRLRPIEAIGALLPSCPPSFSHDERLADGVCRFVSAVVAKVPVYHLECLPDAAAAELACKTVLGR